MKGCIYPGALLKAAMLLGIFLAACSSTEPKLGLPTVITLEVNSDPSYEALARNEVEVSPPVNGYFTPSPIAEPPPPPPLMSCGGVYLVDESALADKLLAQAKVVLDFRGVREVWIPLNGQPKRRFLFAVR